MFHVERPDRGPSILPAVPRGTCHLISLCLLLHATPALAAAFDALTDARAAHTTQLLAQAAGLFWLGGELAMLYVMGLARRHLSERPLMPTIILTSAERRRAIVYGSVFLFAVLAIVLRHAMWPPIHVALEALMTGEEAATYDEVGALYAHHVLTHFWIWTAFITIWVVLECAIVYQGWHVYRAVMRLLAEPVGEVAAR